MAKKITAPTFMDELHTRHQAFRPVEESGARQIRHEMNRIKQQALRTVETGMASATDAGRYLTDAQAVERAKDVIADVEDVVARGLGKVDGDLLSLKEGAWQRGLRDFEVAAESLPGAPKSAIAGSFQQLFPEAAEAALTRPVMGIRPSAMWKGVEASTNENVRQTLMHAVLSGEGVDETATALAEGLDISNSAAERVARTNLNAMYNDAHYRVYNANPEIFAGYRWLAALDDRTSAICIRLHGSFFPLGTYPPGPPAHWNCRSLLQGVFKDNSLQAEMLDDRQRVKKYDAEGNFKDVFIKTKTPADVWLRREPAWVQQQVLGSKTKAELFKAGKATIKDIVSPAMQVLSDKQLVQRMAALRPRDRELQTLAKELGIRVPSKRTILAEDRKLAKNQWFQQPQDMPNPGQAPPPPVDPLPLPTKKPPKDPSPKKPGPEGAKEDFERLDREWVTARKRVDNLEAQLRTLEAKRSVTRKEYLELNKQKKALRAEITEARKGMRSAAGVRKEAWERVQRTGARLDVDGPAQIPKNYSPLNLERANITQREFDALKGELDDLLERHLKAKAAPFRDLPRRPKGPLTGRNAALNKEREKLAFENMQNTAFKRRADDMAFMRIQQHRARQEMTEHLGDLTALDSKAAQQKIKDKLRELATRGTGHEESTDRILKNIERQFTAQGVGAGKKKSMLRELRELLDMTDESALSTYRGSRLESINIQYTKAYVRGHANEISNEIMVSALSDRTTWVHELGHHWEYRIGQSKYSTAWRDYAASQAKGQRYGLIYSQKDAENGYLGSFWHNYVGKSYGHGSTEASSMGVQSLYSSGDFTKMMRKNPDQMELLWAMFRGWLR